MLQLASPSSASAAALLVPRLRLPCPFCRNQRKIRNVNRNDIATAYSSALGTSREVEAAYLISRRKILATALGCVLLSARVCPVEAVTAQDFVAAFQEYKNEQQGYRMQRPSAWNQTSKAGADVLFEDPQRKSSTLGVTVSPIRIESLDAFGDLDNVAARLLAAEKAKDSTTGVQLVQQTARKGASSGVTIYDFEYELDSTRGRKRIINTVAIAEKRLFIVNGTAKCEGGVCNGAALAAADLMRQAAASFDVL